MLSIILTIVGLIAIAGLLYSAHKQLSEGFSKNASNNEDFNHLMTRDKAAALSAHMGNMHRIR